MSHRHCSPEHVCQQQSGRTCIEPGCPEPSKDERADLRDLIFHHEYIDGASGTMRDAEALRDAIFVAGFTRRPMPSREQVAATLAEAYSASPYRDVHLRGADAVLALFTTPKDTE